MQFDLSEQTNLLGPMVQSFEHYWKMQNDLVGITSDQIRIAQHYWKGVYKYLDDFMHPYYIAQDAFLATERKKVTRTTIFETMRDYFELFQFNLQVAKRGYDASQKIMGDLHQKKASKAFTAFLAAVSKGDLGDLARLTEKEANLLERVIVEYPQAIYDIGQEFGFHLNSGGYVKTAETDRFGLYQVLPTDPNVKVREDGKPVIVVHPYVLGANIICFLPSEQKSFVHAYANQGIPTYARILKDISNPAVQTMTGEDDCKDMKMFCETLYKKHNRQVTINGFCQGGFVAVCELLSGELDGLVDAMITCVSPMDGTRSISLVEYLQHLPPRFRDLGYAVKTLPNGNRVVDGKVMSWVYKLKSMEKESPLFCLYRDLNMFDRPHGEELKISKTAAALNHWLIYDRNDLPEAITKMSFDSYTIPVQKDGTLPVKLFGRKLNFKRIQEKGQKMLICYAGRDDLVDKATAVAPLDYIDVETTEFPKGHGAIATSWSHPESECALHKRFGENNQRGPVRFHLDLQDGKA